MSLRKILVATDFSTASDHAIDTALGLADAGARVTLFHVCELPPYSTPDLGMYVPSPEMTQDLIAGARQALDQRKASLAARGFAVDVAWATGPSAGPEIVRFAAQHEYDLIVVGSHGRRGFRRFVLGSVAERVVRTADRPVLTVHERDANASAQLSGDPATPAP